ncbi:DNA cytosine methyltransferase [Nocardia sp. NPDC055321]
MPPDVTDPKQVKMVDLFAGPGGLDVGAQWLGVPVTGIEFDENACATRRAAGLGTVQADVRHCKPDTYLTETVLTGGPPCQTYSVAGAGAGREALDQVRMFVKRMGAEDKTVDDDIAQLKDERTGLVLEPLKWALQSMKLGHPFQTIVLEQVPTVLPVWEEYAEVLESRGYRADARVLCTEEFGVPQTRRRAVLIANLERQPLWPKATHRKFDRTVGEPDGDRRRWVSMGKALGRKDKFVVVSNYGTGGDPKARGRRSSDEPAFTVTGKVSRNRMVDQDDNYIGHLKIEDAGRLQTFPRDYPWSGNDIAQQIGNAIPPRLAAHILGAAIFGKQPDEKLLDKAVAGTWKAARRGDYRLIPGFPAEAEQHEPLTLFEESGSMPVQC